MKTGPQQRTSGVTGHFNAVLANPIPCFTIPSELTSCPLYMLSPRKSSGGLSASTSSHERLYSHVFPSITASQKIWWQNRKSSLLVEKVSFLAISISSLEPVEG